MTPDELRYRIELLYGRMVIGEFARSLRVAPRTVRRWLNGETRIPAGIEIETRGLLNDKFHAVKAAYEMLDRKTREKSA